MLWRWKGPQRIRSLVEGRLLTIAERMRRHLVENDNCHLCLGVSEDILHVLRDYIIAKGVWQRLLPAGQWQPFFSSSSIAWLIGNLASDPIEGNGIGWPTRFGIVYWSLWQKRNDWVFHPTSIATHVSISSKINSVVVLSNKFYAEVF